MNERLSRPSFTVLSRRRLRTRLAAALVAAAIPAGIAAAQQTAGTAVSTLITPASNASLSVPVAQLTPEQIASMQHLLSDWAQLERYRADNQALVAPANGQQRVVFYGDSITDNWGRLKGHFFPDEPWVNRGISGQTTPQMLVRFRQDVIALHPEAVVILAGANDIAGNTGPESLGAIEDNLRSMVALAKAEHIRVVLCSVLPVSHFPWHPGVDPRDEVVALNKWLRSFAAEQQLVYVDYYAALVAPDGGIRPELAIDAAVHPNDAGYAIMEPLAHAAVLKALAAPRP